MSADKIKTLDEMRLASTVNGQVKYPLECGCKSEHYYGMCSGHQAEHVADQARRMGIADLRFTHRDFLDLPSLVRTLHAVKLQLISNPTKSCIIKVIPHGGDDHGVQDSGETVRG